ncbi:glycoside hydrolase, partial [bacterium]|nr:glycoside hydrolase [bacterium]
ESRSTDGGLTWTPHEPVRLETVASRMHVLAAGGDRFMMVHNDWPAGVFVSDRENLALFFTRGSGRNFVAGPGLSEGQPVVCYPQMWLRDNAVWVSYSQGLHTRSICWVRVSPLPDPSRYYLSPRTYWTADPAPVRVDDALRFDGRQRLLTREPVTLGKAGFTLCARLRAQEAGVLLDTRASRGRSGFVLALTPGEQQGLRPFGFVDSPERNVTPSLGFGTSEWVYVAVSVDLQAGLMTFRVNDRAEQVKFSADKAAPIDGATGSIGDRRNPTSALRGLTGEIRGMALYPAPSLSAAEHAWVAEKLGGSLPGSEATPTAPAMAPVLWLDAADKAATKRDFATETASGPVLQSEQLEGERVLRLGAGASAGVDVDENCRDRGDGVELVLRFRPVSAEEAVLCTVGDAESPARVICRQGEVRLQAAGQDLRCGEARPTNWTELALVTAGDQTTVRLNGGPAVTVRHSPTDTWLYLGEGYRSAAPRPGSVVMSVASVRTRVSRGDAPATTRQ